MKCQTRKIVVDLKEPLYIQPVRGDDIVEPLFKGEEAKKEKARITPGYQGFLIEFADQFGRGKDRCTSAVLSQYEELLSDKARQSLELFDDMPVRAPPAIREYFGSDWVYTVLHSPDYAQTRAMAAMEDRMSGHLHKELLHQWYTKHKDRLRSIGEHFIVPKTFKFAIDSAPFEIDEKDADILIRAKYVRFDYLSRSLLEDGSAAKVVLVGLAFEPIILAKTKLYESDMSKIIMRGDAKLGAKKDF